jgi:hypothetical protein
MYLRVSAAVYMSGYREGIDKRLAVPVDSIKYCGSMRLELESNLLKKKS